MENTTKFSNIEEVSTAFNLDITETTTGVNGYPKQLRPVLSGFKSISECLMIKEVLEAEGHTVYDLKLHKRHGWQLWERIDTLIRKGMFTTASDSDYYVDITIHDETEEIAFDIICRNRTFETLYEIKNAVSMTEDLAEELEDILADIDDDGQESVRVFYNPDQNCNIDYYVHADSTGYEYDTHEYSIALMVEFKEVEDEG